MPVEVLKQIGFPRQIGVRPRTKTTDRKLSADAHAPYFVGGTAGQPLDPRDVFTPLPKGFPRHSGQAAFAGLPAVWIASAF